MKRKITTILLILAIVIMTMSIAMVAVFAAESDTTEKIITLGTSAIANGDKANNTWDYVYFGTYSGNQIKWRVLSTSGNGGTYRDANWKKYDASQNGALFLLSEYAMENRVFDASSNTWYGSDVRTWLQDTFGTTSNFSQQELNAVLITTKTEDSETLYSIPWGNSDLSYDTFFFISAKEAFDYLGENDRDEGLIAYLYHDTDNKAEWWLRSSHADLTEYAGDVEIWGNVNYSPVMYGNSTRPAFNLDSSSVLFTSPAKDVKGDFGKNTDLASDEGYKLTLYDSKRSDFSATIFKSDTGAVLSYSGATTGTNEHITALIVNANGEVTYYGSLKNITESTDSSGSIEIDLSCMNSGDKVYILNEQWNGDYKSDYSSALQMTAIRTGKNITLGTSAIVNGDKANNLWDYVYFGRYSGTQLKWRVLSTSGNGGTYTDAEGNNSDEAIFLLSEYAMNEGLLFNSDVDADNSWENSDARTWVQNTFGSTSNFSEKELRAVLNTTKTDISETLYNETWAESGLSDDKFFLISVRELEDYLGEDNAENTYLLNDQFALTAIWWLRSHKAEHYVVGYNAGLVSGDGVESKHVDFDYSAARPAFNLNSASVLFTSPANVGKTAFGVNADLSSDEGYKLTLLDASRSGFSAEIFKTVDKAYLYYQGATTGANEYITAMIVNANGEVTYYGSLKNITQASDASGKIKVDICDRLNDGDKLYILNEQWNGNHKTDYASELKAVTISTEKSIVFGTDAICDADKVNNEWDYIYFGTYGDTPIKWRVLSTSGNGGSYTDANGDAYDASQNGAMFLLSEYAFEDMEFDASSVNWQGSAAQTWAKETFGTTSNFSEKELRAVLNTTKASAVKEDTYQIYWVTGELNNDTFFFISPKEAADYLSENASNQLKVYYYNNTSVGATWWLRAYCYTFNGLVGVIFDPVRINIDSPYNTYAARPAFNLNSASVLFTSPAIGGKTAFGTNADLASNEGHKVTLLDASRNTFTAEILKTVNKTYLRYQGATTGDNEYITAMIVNVSGEVTYYGSLKNITETTDANGLMEIDLSCMNSGDKLYILNEQWNGDYNTDYASALNEVAVPTDVNAYDITFDNNGGIGTMDGVLIDHPDYTLPECAFTYEGYVFVGWSYSADGTIINENSITLTQDLTLYAVWSPRSETIAALDKAIEDLDSAMKAGNENLSSEIANLNMALTNAQSALEWADTANKTELENKITTAQTTLQTAIDEVAQNLDNAKSELNAAIRAGNENLSSEIANLNTALTNAQSALEWADTANKTELENKITTAQTTLQSAIDEVAQNLDIAKSELNAAIRAGNENLSSEITNLNKALANAQSALEATDAASKTELENEITAAQVTLQSAIDKVSQDLDTVKSELAQKDSELQTFIIITCVLSCVALCGIGGFAAWFFIDRRKNRG